MSGATRSTPASPVFRLYSRRLFPTPTTWRNWGVTIGPTNRSWKVGGWCCRRAGCWKYNTRPSSPIWKDRRVASSNIAASIGIRLASNSIGTAEPFARPAWLRCAVRSTRVRWGGGALTSASSGLSWGSSSRPALVSATPARNRRPRPQYRSGRDHARGDVASVGAFERGRIRNRWMEAANSHILRPEDRFVKRWLAALLLIGLAPMSLRSARADSSYDMATFSCQDWLDASYDERDLMLVWLRGYLGGRSGTS